MRLNFTLLVLFLTVSTAISKGAEKINAHRTAPALSGKSEKASNTENDPATADVRKPVTLTLNNSVAITKQYDGTAVVTLKPENYVLNGLEEADKGKVSVSGTASFNDANAGSNKTVTVTNLVLSGSSKDFYSLTTVSATTTGTITRAILTVAADDKQSCQGTIPALSGTYRGFVGTETEANLTSRPAFSTTATASSKAGTYPITAAGGSSPNYTFNFVRGTLTLKAGPAISIKSDRGFRISRGESVKLTATSASGSTFSWSDAPGFQSVRNTATVQVRPAETTTYTVTATGPEGCPSTASVTITVLDDYKTINARNILTPNNDGKNDTWIVENIDVYPNNEVTVYDRGGRVVYSKKSYDNSWDGTYQGTPLTQGTYYYVIDFGDGLGKFKGYVTLLRR